MQVDARWLWFLAFVLVPAGWLVSFLIYGRLNSASSFPNEASRKQSPFRSRALQIGVAKGKWVITLAFIVFMALVVAIAVVNDFETKQMQGLYLKLGVAPPFAFAIWFCAVQYGRERKLEESYEQRESVVDAVEKYAVVFAAAMDKVGSAQGHEEFAALLVQTAKNLFASPVSYAFGQNESGTVKSSLDTAKELSKTVQSLTETVAKLKKNI